MDKWLPTINGLKLRREPDRSISSRYRMEIEKSFPVQLNMALPTPRFFPGMAAGLLVTPEQEGLGQERSVYFGYRGKQTNQIGRVLESG